MATKIERLSRTHLDAMAVGERRTFELPTRAAAMRGRNHVSWYQAMTDKKFSCHNSLAAPRELTIRRIK